METKQWCFLLIDLEILQDMQILFCEFCFFSAVIFCLKNYLRYMNDAVVVEEGTHDLLIKYNGEYARIWKLQACAFL